MDLDEYNTDFIAEGMHFLVEDRKQDAIKSFTFAISHKQNLADAHYWRALTVYNSLKNKIISDKSLKKIKSDLDESIKYNPSNPNTYIFRGMIHELLSQHPLSDLWQVSKGQNDSSPSIDEGDRNYAKLNSDELVEAVAEQIMKDFSMCTEEDTESRKKDLEAFENSEFVSQLKLNSKILNIDFDKLDVDELSVYPFQRLREVMESTASQYCYGPRDAALRDYLIAIELLTNSTQEGLVHFEAFLCLGRLLLLSGRPILAIIAYNRSIYYNPKNEEAYIGRAIAYIELGPPYYNRSQDDLKTAMEFNPNSSYGHLWKARVLQLTSVNNELYNDALSEYEKSIKLAPNSPYAYVDKARLLWIMWRNTEAFKYYDLAIKYMNRARGIKKHSNLSEFIDVFQALWYEGGHVFLKWWSEEIIFHLPTISELEREKLVCHKLEAGKKSGVPPLIIPHGITTVDNFDNLCDEEPEAALSTLINYLYGITTCDVTCDEEQEARKKYAELTEFIKTEPVLAKKFSKDLEILSIRFKKWGRRE
jgi:tetratricopeptide (TPR) repeat protein